MGMGSSSPLDRRTFLLRAAGASTLGIAGRGVYGLLESYARPQRALAATSTRRAEQYLIDQLEVLLDNSTTVVIPPVYNDVVTARLAAGRTWNRAALRSAQTRLEAALKHVEAPYPATAAGLTIVVAWGLPYFRGRVAAPWAKKGPRDVGAPLQGGQHPFALLDAIRFPSDPGSLQLEANDVAFKLRSDHQATLQSVEQQLFDDVGGPAYVGDLFDLTSKRIGFLGRGFGTTSAGKQLALAAGVPGAASIPDRSQLMMGFTSTQTAAIGPDNIVSFETLRGMTDQFPSGYFAHGCAMHLSHLEISLDSWYGKSYAERVARMMSPGTAVPADSSTVTFANGAAQVSTIQQVKSDAASYHRAGHNSALQTATRLLVDTMDNYGRLRRKGTPIPVREDFNTLDNPFAWYVDGSGAVHQPAANQPGLHFAAFVPTSAAFHRARLAMDGVLPDGTDLRAQYGLTDADMGINSTITTTHRQNFLVPPRARRSFPLAELV